MLKNPPLLTGAFEFTATGQIIALPDVLAYDIPTKYSLQVTGVDAAGAAAAPSAWDVLLLASLDGVTYTEASKILEHVNTSNGNGDVVFSAGSFYPARAWAIKCKALTLGATATKIKVAILGVK
jgi:hypothetical protein